MNPTRKSAKQSLLDVYSMMKNQTKEETGEATQMARREAPKKGDVQRKREMRQEKRLMSRERKLQSYESVTGVCVTGV
jgi:hypothetical protein